MAPTSPSNWSVENVRAIYKPARFQSMNVCGSAVGGAAVGAESGKGFIAASLRELGLHSRVDEQHVCANGERKICRRESRGRVCGGLPVDFSGERRGDVGSIPGSIRWAV